MGARLVFEVGAGVGDCCPWFWLGSSETCVVQHLSFFHVQIALFIHAPVILRSVSSRPAGRNSICASSL
jgi:hypothetical protein